MQNNKNRFSGIVNLYSESQLNHLNNSHICVIGIGGVGSWAVEVLARSGIGHITLIDLDDICVTNINRQVHALSNSIGQLKTEVMRQRISQINPNCQVNIIDDFLSIENIAVYINKQFDYVIDAIDNALIKAALIAYCKRNKIKIVTTGAAGGKTDLTKITSGDLYKTIQDPLLAKVRRVLKQDYNFPKDIQKKFGVQAIYSTEQLKINASCQTTSSRVSCNNGLGTIITVTATFGFYAANKVINYLLNKI